MCLRTLVLWAGLCFGIAPATGQLPFILAGKVTDDENRPLPGASVWISPEKKGDVTDSGGMYLLSGLPPGEVILSVSFLGYRTHTDTFFLESNRVQNIRLQPSLQDLQEVVITGDYSRIRNRNESLSVEVVNDEFLRRHPGGSLMKSLERLPGVDAIGIGSAQSKPVIRGLNSHRVVVVDHGIKHEGQQWGMDHGLEVDPHAVDRVEVIKGPGSMLYGSDALGGVILLNPADIPEPNTWGGEVDLTGKTNNGLLGTSLQLSGRREKLFAGIRATFSRYGDYRVPADSVDIYSYRAALHRKSLRNTAGREGAVHLEAGWVEGGFSSRVIISRLESRNGFFANAHGLEPRRVDTELHDRSARDIQYPYHHVNHWKAINRSVWRRENNTLEAELGFQQNFRQERSRYVSHGFMPPSFPDTLPFPSDLERQFEKHTYSGNVRNTYQTEWGMEAVLGIQSELQQNRIDGRGFIIPEFDQFRSGGYVVLKQELTGRSLLGAGLRWDGGQLMIREHRDWFPSTDIAGSDTAQIRLLRSEGLDRRFSNWTWTVGYNLNLSRLSFKANLGKSFRMPLAKELSANGVNYHRFSYEVGDPDLSPETAYQLDAGAEWKSTRLAVGITPFVSYFPNYIYLNPGYTHDRLYGAGNQVFTYTQSRVFRAGGEVHAHYEPIRSLKIGLIGEYLYSEQLSGEKKGFTLPLSPPASLLWHLKFEREKVWIWHRFYALADLRMVAAQNRIVPPEEPTPGYTLLSLGTGGTVRIGKQPVNLRLQVQNLLNRKYFNHTSYYRIINVPEQGRNVILNLTVPFGNRTAKNPLNQ